MRPLVSEDFESKACLPRRLSVGSWQGGGADESLRHKVAERIMSYRRKEYRE